MIFNNGYLEQDASPEEVFKNKELLARCGLEQPILWQVAQALGIPVPRHPKELTNYQIERKIK